MPNQKISELTTIVTVDNAVDLFPIVDTSANTTKKITPTALKSALALDNVNNTSDANKPVSTAQQDALNGKVTANAAIVAATKTKITYDAKGLVTAGDILDAADMPTGINAANIGTGVVSSTEFGYLDGVTSAIQTQLNAKQATLVSGTNIKTINSTSLLGSGDITISANPSGVAGAIQFSNGSAFASDAANLFWDDTNNRLGVGTNAPTGKTQITESFTTTGNNYSAITFDGTLTSRATASDTIFGFRNTQSIVATALSQTIIANDLSPDYTFFNANTNYIGLKVGGSSNTQNLGTAIWCTQKTTAGNNGLAINPYNNRWAIGMTSATSNTITGCDLILGLNGVGIGISGSNPTTRLQIQGSGSTSATTSLLVQNSAGVQALKVSDNTYTQVTRLYLQDSNDFFVAPSGNPIVADGFHGFRVQRSTGSTQTMFEVSDLFNTTGGLLMNVKNQLFANMFAVNHLGQASMGTASPNASAQFQINSTTRGFLPPVMTTTQKNAISSPAAGLVLYDSTTNKLQCYNGSTWNDLF